MPIYVLIAKGGLAMFESSTDKFISGKYFTSREDAEAYKETFKAACISSDNLFNLKDDDRLRISIVELEMFSK